MDIRQRFLKLTYPVLMTFSRLIGLRRGIYSSSETARTSFFELSMPDSGGRVFNFSVLKGKKTLVVNTASNCGYTAQYGELQYIYSLEQTRLNIIAFPTGDFMDQEYNSDESIRIFCSKYRVAYPLMQKSHVKKRPGQNPVFRWLSHADENGWNSFAPSWNFFKYLIDENGNLTHIFASGVAPEEIRKYI